MRKGAERGHVWGQAGLNDTVRLPVALLMVPGGGLVGKVCALG